MPAILPIALGLGALGLLALTVGKTGATPPNRTPSSTPEKDPPIVPPPPPRPNTFPPGTQTAIVIAPHGVNVRSAPNEGSGVVAAVPQYERVAIVNGAAGTLPATAAAPQGWWQVTTLSGANGYATAEWLFFGTDAEAHMSDAEFQQYQKDHANDEVPIVQGWSFGAAPNARGARTGAAAFAPAAARDRAASFSRFQRRDFDRLRPGGFAWYTPPVVIADYAYASSSALRCVAPSGCHLRTRTGAGFVPSGVVVENGGLITGLSRLPAPKTDPNAPGPGGWWQVRFTTRLGQTYEGWLPAEWLVSA
jgi:hypothetical protein